MRISDWSSDVCSSDLAATFALLAYQRHVIRQTESVAIGTDHLHYQSDLFLNLSVIIALALDQYFGFPAQTPCSESALRSGWRGTPFARPAAPWISSWTRNGRWKGGSVSLRRQDIIPG